MTTAVSPAPNRLESPRLIAPLWHTIVLLIILSIPAGFGAMLQARHASGTLVFSNHSQAMLRFYLPVLIFEWLLVLYIWFGIRKRGKTLHSLIGGSWSGRGFVLDVGVALLVVAAMLVIGGVLSRVLGPDHAKGIGVLLPRSNPEMLLWIVIAGTAGFVEELVYRGYLQTQLARIGLPPMPAVAGQALIFGLGHAYEGRNAVIVITAYAMLFGAVALWRKSLRPGMVGHTWFDIVVVFLMPK